MDLPRDILDLVLCYTGDDRLLSGIKSKKVRQTAEFHNRIYKAKVLLEKTFIRYKIGDSNYDRYVTNHNYQIRRLIYIPAVIIIPSYREKIKNRQFGGSLIGGGSDKRIISIGWHEYYYTQRWNRKQVFNDIMKI